MEPDEVGIGGGRTGETMRLGRKTMEKLKFFEKTSCVSTKGCILIPVACNERNEALESN